MNKYWEELIRAVAQSATKIAYALPLALVLACVPTVGLEFEAIHEGQEYIKTVKQILPAANETKEYGDLKAEVRRLESEVEYGSHVDHRDAHNPLSLFSYQCVCVTKKHVAAQRRVFCESREETCDEENQKACEELLGKDFAC